MKRVLIGDVVGFELSPGRGKLLADWLAYRGYTLDEFSRHITDSLDEFVEDFDGWQGWEFAERVLMGALGHIGDMYSDSREEFLMAVHCWLKSHDGKPEPREVRVSFIRALRLAASGSFKDADRLFIETAKAAGWWVERHTGYPSHD